MRPPWLLIVIACWFSRSTAGPLGRQPLDATDLPHRQQQLPSKPCADQFEGPSGRLDPGEASAIARALEIDAGLLLDDRAAVVYARALGLKVIGTLGLLVLAKRRGEIAQVAPLIGQLQAGGHYVGPGAVQAALRAEDEMVR